MNRWSKFIGSEMEVEQKSPLYCYTIMFFYLGYRLLAGSTSASVAVIAEIIFLTYAMGFVQLYLLNNFDESEELTWNEALKAAFCSFIYTAVSWACKWFDRSLAVTILFFFFMLLCFGCVFWFYSVKRAHTTHQMNVELAAYKQKAKENQQ